MDTHEHTHAHKRAHEHTNTRTHAHTHKDMRTRAHPHKHMHTQARAHTHTYNTCKLASVSKHCSREWKMTFPPHQYQYALSASISAWKILTRPKGWP